MSFLNPTKTCVFSAVKARLTNNGQPLKGATVIRRWEWHELKEERTTTNAQGEFEFPAVYESSVTRLLPMEIVIGQSLRVVVDGEERKFWTNSKRNADLNGEYRGRLMRLTCELTNESKIYNSAGVMMSTLCTLDT